MRKIRIAQIGLNRFSHSAEVFLTLAAHSDIFEVVGYAVVEDERETCAEKIKGLANYHEITVEEILNDPSIEAVTIETDEIHLTKYAQMAADHGKHIHMEKPGSQNLADFEKLIDTVRRNGTVFHVGYMYRYNPYVKEAIKRVKNGEIGKIFATEAHMSRLDGVTVREWLNSFKGGMMFYLGCHLIDLVLQVQGCPQNVIALNRSTGLGGIISEDYGLAMLEYPTGFSMVRTAATEVGGFDRRQFVIMGEHGTIEINPLEGFPTKEEQADTRWAQYVVEIDRINDKNGKRVDNKTKSNTFGRYDDMMVAFASMVRGDIENPYSLEYEFMLYKTILKCCGVN